MTRFVTTHMGFEEQDLSLYNYGLDLYAQFHRMEKHMYVWVYIFI